MSPPPSLAQEHTQASAAIRAGQRVFPWRIVVGLVAVAAGALFIRPRELFGEYRVIGNLASLALVALGLGLRAWAAACAGGHTRSAHIEAPRLVTGGPYAHVRNPIYLGSFVLGLGMVGLLGDPWLFIPHALVFAVFFGLIVPAEERFLAREFGEEYERFRHAVPRFIPHIEPWPGRTEPQLTWRAARGEAPIGIFLVVIYAAFRAVLIFQD